LPHDLEIVNVDVGDSTSQYHTPLAVAKFTGKWKKIKSGYFIATPRIALNCSTTLQEFHWQDSFTVPEDTSCDFTCRSLHLEFVLSHPPHSSDLAPSDFHLFGSLKAEL